MSGEGEGEGEGVGGGAGRPLALALLPLRPAVGSHPHAPRLPLVSPLLSPAADDADAEPDYLLPFLLAAKAGDVGNPTEKEARKADRECRAAFHDRLLERAAIIQRRLEEENDKLLRRQQAFSRSRDHTEAAEREFAGYVADAEFRISILQQRLERQQALLPAALADMERRLVADPRLAVIHNPAAWRERQAEAGMGAGE